jgi:protein tyrosine phosphatase
MCLSDDHTRVALEPLRGVGTDDYINASYINVKI